MSSLVHECRAALTSAGYRTFVPMPHADSLYFEDDSVLGVLYELRSVDDVLNQWETLQDAFLRDNAIKLGTAPTKAWNSYAVFLTSDSHTQDVASKLFAIEEDFRGARKIARAGVKSRQDVDLALAPLLPLRRLLSLTSEDLRGRLITRIGAADPSLHALLTDMDPKLIAASLLTQP